MVKLKCNTCGGTYSPVQDGGSAYYHACAPSGTDSQGRAIERPNKRDENIALDEQGMPAGIKAAGLGVTAV